MESLTPAPCRTSLARICRACVNLLLLLPLTATAQAKTDLTSTLTTVAPRTVAKDFALKDLDGKLQHLTDYRGKVVLINFWGSWCPPCRREMPSMERLYQNLKAEPFAVLAINQSESLDLVFAFTGEIEPAPTFPMLLDDKGKIPPKWGVRGLPASFIVDKQGRIAYRAMGGREFDHPDIEKTLRALIPDFPLAPKSQWKPLRQRDDSEDVQG